MLRTFNAHIQHNRARTREGELNSKIRLCAAMAGYARPQFRVSGCMLRPQENLDIHKYLSP